MERYSLDGKWQLKILGENVYHIPEEYVECNVPGTVFGTYIRNGSMPDPYYRENELGAVQLADNDYEYRRQFSLEPAQLETDRLLLVFEGIDTLSDVYLNGQLLGSTQNMHTRYEFDVLGVANAGENELKVVIHSPVKYIRQENEKVYTGGSGDAMEGYPHLRKSHCMFGWDWGLRLPDSGIFRPVYLLGIHRARLGDVRIEQTHREGKVYLRAIVKAEDADGRTVYSCGASADGAEAVNGCCGTSADDGETLSDCCGKLELICRFSVTSPQGEIFTADGGCEICIEHPELWWPNGYGEQPLYTARVELAVLPGADGRTELLDVWERRIGLRTVTVDTQPDQWGRKFAHQVNGLYLFAMGADYIPEDALLDRVNEQRTRRLLEDCVAAHHNCIRVWGGGYYLDDYFYDICDELGLLVWQDFMFACSSYELDDEFDRNIREEITQNVRRLRHHACIGLWCGNNEMETQTLDGSWKPSAKQKCDYIKLFEYIIPGIVKEEDPQAFYWPSSPSSGGSYDNPWDENRGDAHYWDVWHGEKPFTDYRKYRFRYLSEFGFQSFPELKTVETFTAPEDRNIFSRVMEMHQRNRAANGKILSYLAQTYLYPKDFDSLLYASQLLQADAIRYGVEHFRRHRGRCMGAVVWQLNDNWPVASWAGIDYYGRWKALHYAECRMFAPVMISCEETGELTERPSCVQERREPIELAARLHVANETRQPVSGTVYWELRRPDASVIRQDSENVTVPAFDGVWLDKQDFSGEDERGCYISFRFEADGEILSTGTALFTPPKHFKFENPHLTVTREGDTLRVNADAYAKNVEILALDGDVRLSDNFFDMNGGERTVQIVSGEASKFAVRSVYDIA